MAAWDELVSIDGRGGGRWQGSRTIAHCEFRQTMDSSGATLMSGTIVEADNYVTCLQTCGRQSDSCRWQRIPVEVAEIH
jgi:hypothetical protein